MTEQTNPVCPICKSSNPVVWDKTTDKEYLTSDEEFTYKHCPDCNTIYIQEFLTSRLNEIYPSNYYSFLDQKKNFALQVKEYLDKRYFNQIVKRFKGKKINILDIGGGSGWLVDIIKSVYPNVDITQVVDIDINAKKIAEDNGHLFFHGPIEEFKTDVKFDLVLMLNLIEHISSPKETLEKIEQLLTPDGVILIKTPNIDSWDARLFKNSYWGGLHAPRHWVLFSQESFRKMLEGTHLKINSISYTQGAPFWAWSVLIAGKKRGLFNITKERPVMYHPLIPILHMVFAGLDFIRNTLGFKTSQMMIVLEKGN